MRVIDNPLQGHETDELKRQFSVQIEALQAGRTDGLLRRSMAKLMELELKTRGVDPADALREWGVEPRAVPV